MKGRKECISTGSAKTTTVNSIDNFQNRVAYAGIAAFALMSLFNFTVQAIPVFCLFIVYVACFVSLSNNSITVKKRFLFNRAFYFPATSKIFLAIPLLVIALFTGLNQASLARASFLNVKAKTLAREGSYAEAIELLQSLEDPLKGSEAYWQNYGLILSAGKNYVLALDKFENAKALTSHPDLYMAIGHCSYKTGRLEEAQIAFQIAGNIEPNRFAPRFALMKLYQMTGDTTRMLAQAREIVAFEPKVSSAEVQEYKAQAGKILQQTKNL